MPADVRFNPYAGFAASDEPAPDVEYLVAQRALFVDLCVVYAAGNAADGDWYVDPAIDESAWLDAADHAYPSGGAQ